MEREPQQHVIVLTHPEMLDSGEIANFDRAAMVAPLIEAYAKTYYWGGEYLDTIVQDFISNLGHLIDNHDGLLVGVPGIVIRDDINDASMDFDDIVARGVSMYEEEVALERLSDEEAQLETEAAF
jgi:hypothetical protein